MDEQTRWALDVVMRHAMTTVLAPGWEDMGDVGWQDYPNLGEDDWERVVRRVGRWREATRPSDHVFEAAYEHLAGRAGE